MTLGNNDFVAVILGTGLNAYNISRSLHEAYGVSSLALGRFALRETADSTIVQVRTKPDFDQDEVIMQTLREVAAEFNAPKLVLFPTIEHYTNVVLRHRDELDPRYVVPLLDQQLADKLMNKTDFYRTCAELGVPHPETVVLEPGDIDPTFGDDLPFPYPVILKPANTDIYPALQFEGKEKVYKVADASRLREISARIFAAGYDDDLIVQEYLAGDEAVMQVANSYSTRAGQARFISAGQVVLTEYNPALVGNNNAIISIADAELTDSLRRFLDGVGYVGLANFDMMYDRRTGQSKLLEVNLRPGATSYYVMAGGGNLIRCVIEDLVYGRELPFTVTGQERLWINVPYPVVLRYAPASLRARTRAAARSGKVHTLDYAPDRSRARRLNMARLDVRHGLDHFKHSDNRPR